MVKRSSKFSTITQQSQLLLVYASFKFGTSLVNATKSDFKTVNYVSAKATTQF